MGQLDILLIEDEKEWQELVQTLLKQLGDDVRVTPAYTYREALEKLQYSTYDLAIVDLSLMPVSNAINLPPADFKGLELMRRWNNDKDLCGRGLIVLSGYGSPEIIGTAYKNYGVDVFIDKGDDWHVTFLDEVRAAILKGRLRHAALLDKRRYLVNITYSSDSFIGIELAGPDTSSDENIEPALPFGVADTARRTNNISELLTDETFSWRNEADSVGRAWYRFLMSEPGINAHWSTALGRVRDRRDLRLQFSGPAVGLGLPFELLHDGNDYLCFEHILTRRLSGVANLALMKAAPFHEFINELNEQELHLLIIGANSDGTIEGAEIEAAKLAQTIKSDLDEIGLRCSIKALIGSDATHANVSRELESSFYHIVHYSGHCFFDEEHPERSGLELGPKSKDVLTANQLNMLCKNKPRLRMFNLSCCLGARATERLSRGDFYGVVEAVSRAGVPIVLGYRWTVADRSALLFSTAFYDELWRSFSPGSALVKARRTIASESLDDNGNVLERDDDAWASPVMVIQSRM